MVEVTVFVQYFFHTKINLKGKEKNNTFVLQNYEK